MRVGASGGASRGGGGREWERWGGGGMSVGVGGVLILMCNFTIFKTSMHLLDSKFSLYSVLSQLMLYILHAEIALFNFIQCHCSVLLPLYHSTTISLHFLTQLSVPILSTCPNHLFCAVTFNLSS